MPRYKLQPVGFGEILGGGKTASVRCFLCGFTRTPVRWGPILARHHKRTSSSSYGVLAK